MKVSELIDALKAMPQDALVYGVSDHGQTPEQVCAPTVYFVEETEYTLWEGYHREDDEICEATGYTKIVVL
jgi:hypothetical protein